VLDREIVSRIQEVQNLELVLVTGHTDRLGSQEYNQRLSERRAAAVAAYLASKGVAKNKIETLGMGKTQPVPGVVCEQKDRKALIACLQPHRRVEVEVKGEIVIRR
jgi:OmpA-OmpF porin, OOP family